MFLHLSVSHSVHSACWDTTPLGPDRPHPGTPEGVSGPRGVPALGGGACSEGGGIPACTEAEPPHEQNDRQV